VSTAPNKERIRKGFDRLSPFYDALVRIFFGRSLTRTQLHFLPELKTPGSALIFGGGTGKILAEMIRQDIAKTYCYVDISEKMIAKAKKRTAGKNNGVEFICGSYDAIPQKKFDLIVTPFVLDCFTDEELALVMKTLQERLAPGGKWLFADFNVPEKGARTFSRFLIRILYFFFNVICGLGVKKLPGFEQHFEVVNMKKVKEEFFLRGMLTAKVYSRL
jgi:tRNA (cmo5U34)-methyltransferase